MAQEQPKTKISNKEPDTKQAGDGSDSVSRKDSEGAARRTEKLTEKLSQNLPPAKAQNRSNGKTATSTQKNKDSRRPAEPARDRIAANDDLPSIGGL
ncbi:MAG: hypothetical protein ACTSP0_10700, partial [Alphaproteobacteria bacterium]